MKDEKKNNWYPINHQIRLIAGEDYISYWSKLLRNETNENAPDFRSTGYDFKIFDDCAEMMDAIKEKTRNTTDYAESSPAMVSRSQNPCEIRKESIPPRTMTS